MSLFDIIRSVVGFKNGGVIAHQRDGRPFYEPSRIKFKCGGRIKKLKPSISKFKKGGVVSRCPCHKRRRV